jgi:hypothetical protein
LDSKIDFASSASTFSKNKTITIINLMIMMMMIIIIITIITTIMHSKTVHWRANTQQNVVIESYKTGYIHTQYTYNLPPSLCALHYMHNMNAYGGGNVHLPTWMFKLKNGQTNFEKSD